MKKEIDNSGQKSFPFPETAGEHAGNVETAIPHNMSGSHNASFHSRDESSHEVPTKERDSAHADEVATSDLKDDSEQVVDSHEAVPQTRPGDLIPGVDDAGDSHVRCEPSNTATAPSNTPNDRAGGEPQVSEGSDRIATSAAGPGPASWHDDEVRVKGDKVSPGVQPNRSSSPGVCRDYSREQNSIATSEDVKEANPPSNDAAKEADKPTDRALPDSEEGQTVLKGSTGAGLDEAGADVPKQEELKTTGAFSEVGDSEQGGESKQSEEGVSAPVQDPVVPTSLTSKQSGRRKLHPQVIVNERDTLSKSEKAILDRLKELNREQLKAFPYSPPDEVQAGYSDLLTESVACTKTAQRNIPKLIEKGFINFVKKGNEENSGSRAKYRIVPEDKVKERRLEKKLTHWVQVGLAHKVVPEPEESNEHDD